MASALMAFVQGLGAEKQEIEAPTSQPNKQAPLDEVDEVEGDMFADSYDEKEPREKAPTLLEVAKQEAASATPSLIEVAKSLENESAGLQEDRPKPTLAALAAGMNQEEHELEAVKAQTDKVQHALNAASSEVRAERVAQRNEQVVTGLRAAVVEQQQQYEDEGFEDDAASVRAAAETIAASVVKAKSVGHRSPSRSRSKPLKGSTSSQSLSKVELQRALQDKLSAFQFQQLSLTQRRLFLASLGQVDGSSNTKPKKRVANREALNELAKDKFTRARQKQKPGHEFARLDDNRHCRFAPRLHNSSSKKAIPNNNSDDEEGPGGSKGAALRRNEDFVRRMEAAERARQEQLRRTREEAAYLVRVDKKECSSCGNPQSYSELTQKRKKCPNCGVTYKSRIAWSDVAKDFLARMEEFQQQCKERQREKLEESERREALTCQPEDDDDDTKKTWEEVRDEFLGRLQLDLEYREMSRTAIWEEIQRECSFSPSITRRAQQMELGDFDERLRRDLDERRLRREQFAARAEAAATREREFERRNASVKPRKHVTPSAPFQERLRQDVAKRRERERQQCQITFPAVAAGMAGGRNLGRSSSSRHAPPLPFDRSQNEPVRVYPPEPGRGGSLAALQSLQNKNVAVVGLLSTSSSSSSRSFAFANRLIGRCVFRDDEMQSATTVKDVRLAASVHLYYDDVARCIYLLGVARPDSLCFSPPATIKAGTSSNSKNKPSGGRHSTTGGSAEEQSPLSEAQRIRHEMDTFEREKLKMQVLLYSSCNMLILVKEDARVTTNALKRVRALAAEKAQLQSFVPTTTKHSKRDSGHSKGSSSSSSGGGNAFAPGRCVPLVVYVLPAPDEIVHASLKTQGSGPSRSATVTYCKALEARLTTLFRSLRGSTVGSLRMRDALSAANLSKERRVFNLDPAHSVVVVSRRTVTADGRAEAQLEDLLDADISADDILKGDSLLQPLADDDMGFQRLNQYVQKYLDLLFSFSPSGSKDGGRTELLSPPQWLKAFHGLVKSYSRLDSKRRQEAAALEALGSSGASDYLAPASLATYQFDPMELTR
ncbi:hypothetical protein PHYPSEUDO_004593 [Phytophthora pseudosyringae]|uniref:Nonsense-mediated mRNA decay factor SMG8 n=1 Tax=Phytophthora pseudosyringae TaxID=221518 RepID=A0A8T1WHT9_9STRA|nr:hypothetical protein PHYPSEUDO_004593 [Phytophthora pseudosyringae]